MILVYIVQLNYCFNLVSKCFSISTGIFQAASTKMRIISKSWASVAPNRRDSTNPQTEMLVPAILALPPTTPGVFLIPCQVLAKLWANICIAWALSGGVRESSCGSNSFSVIVNRGFDCWECRIYIIAIELFTGKNKPPDKKMYFCGTGILPVHKNCTFVEQASCLFIKIVEDIICRDPL